MAPARILIARAPFAGVSATLPGEGLIVSDRDGLGLATVSVRAGLRAALSQRVSERLGIELPKARRRSQAGDAALISMGPNVWLATCERAANAMAASLRQPLGDLASISDQSDGYAVLRLCGPKVRDALCKLVPLDLHPRAFGVGHVASTIAAHMGTTLWRLEDDARGSAVFEIMIFRSFAASFWAALCASAAEFGLQAPTAR